MKKVLFFFSPRCQQVLDILKKKCCCRRMMVNNTMSAAAVFHMDSQATVINYPRLRQSLSKKSFFFQTRAHRTTCISLTNSPATSPKVNIVANSQPRVNSSPKSNHLTVPSSGAPPPVKKQEAVETARLLPHQCENNVSTTRL